MEQVIKFLVTFQGQGHSKGQMKVILLLFVCHEQILTNFYKIDQKCSLRHIE